MGDPAAKISLTEPAFTHGEAVEVAGVTSKTLNNWTQREIIALGTMHRTGRRLYSAADLVALKVIGALSQNLSVLPSFAAKLAEKAVALKLGTRRPSHTFGVPEEKTEREFFVSWSSGAGRYQTYRMFKGADWLKNNALTADSAIIILPLDEICLSVENAAADLLKRTERN
jgi:hypothetical protein